MSDADNFVPTSELTTVESKLAMMKQRREMRDSIQKQNNHVAAVTLDGAEDDPAPPSKGCFGRVSFCPGWFSKSSGRTRIATEESSSTLIVGTSTQSSSKFDGLFGVQKQQSNKIEVALATVSKRVETLKDRAKLQRERAVSLSQAGKREEAIRELKKARNTDKQVSAAQNALETLERQQDLLSESVLQKELASALASTNELVKSKTKGLLPMSEKAVDTSQDLRDAADDIAAVFDGLQPTYEHDDDELLSELNDLIEDSQPARRCIGQAAAVAVSSATKTGSTVDINAFPTAPKAKVSTHLPAPTVTQSSM